MRTIWKFPLTDDPFTVQMPEAAIIRHIASQDGRPTLWVEVDTEGAPQARTFRILPTGAAVPAGSAFIGTFLSGLLVGHIYEVPPAEWTDWEGGNGPPDHTCGKVVDIIDAGAPDNGPAWTGPADVANWSAPCRYRFAAEQPDLPL